MVDCQGKLVLPPLEGIFKQHRIEARRAFEAKGLEGELSACRSIESCVWGSQCAVRLVSGERWMTCGMF